MKQNDYEILWLILLANHLHWQFKGILHCALAKRILRSIVWSILMFQLLNVYLFGCLRHNRILIQGIWIIDPYLLITWGYVIKSAGIQIYDKSTIALIAWVTLSASDSLTLALLHSFPYFYLKLPKPQLIISELLFWILWMQCSMRSFIRVMLYKVCSSNDHHSTSFKTFRDMLVTN